MLEKKALHKNKTMLYQTDHFENGDLKCLTKEKNCAEKRANHHIKFYLFICFFLSSSLILIINIVIISHQAIVNMCMHWSNDRVHRLGVVAQTGLFGHCTIKGPVLLCLQGQINQCVDNQFYSPFVKNKYLIPVS